MLSKLEQEFLGKAGDVFKQAADESIRGVHRVDISEAAGRRMVQALPRNLSGEAAVRVLTYVAIAFIDLRTRAARDQADAALAVLASGSGHGEHAVAHARVA